VYYENLVEE